jgi:hypothetical protein
LGEVGGGFGRGELGVEEGADQGLVLGHSRP